MTVEDRLRATTEAVTESMHPVRSLVLPPTASGARVAAKPSGARPPRRWPGWLVPLAAAAAVIAVAATLVAVRHLPDAGQGLRDTPAASSTAIAPLPNGMPRYYVALTSIGTSKGGAPFRDAFLADASTGKQLAYFKPPSDAIFDHVAASSDDRTFVLEAVEGSHVGRSGSTRSGTVPPSIIWYVLRRPPGAADQAQLTRVPIASPPGDAGVRGLVTRILGLAVSPDGRTLAVLSQADTMKPSGPVALRTYSLATGQLLRTWTAPLSSSRVGDYADLSWLDDGHTLAFDYPNLATQRYVRTLDITSPGTSLMADSRVVFTVPTGHTCNYSLLLTSDGKAVICGVVAAGSGWCTTGQLALNAYSVATGKLERVLYRYQGGCHFGTALVVWAKSAALAIGLITISKPVNPYPPVTNMVDVITPGKFTSLPVTLWGGTYGAGMVAF